MEIRAQCKLIGQHTILEVHHCQSRNPQAEISKETNIMWENSELYLTYCWGLRAAHSGECGTL